MWRACFGWTGACCAAALAMLAGCAIGCGASGSPLKNSPSDAGDAFDDGTRPPKDGSPFDSLPSRDDLGTDDYGGLPDPAKHVEAIIDGDGGTLSGTKGTVLEGVVLTVPAGALSSSTTLAIDFASVPLPLPTGATSASLYVKVGPDGTSFAVPARLTLPTTAAAGSAIGALARIGTNWGALLDPSGNDVAPTTLTASMARASGALAAAIAFSASLPKPDVFSPSKAKVGSVVFLDGSRFGVAPVWHPAGDGGAAFVSQVRVGSVNASALAWGDDTISFRVPTGATGGTISVATPAGTGNTATSLVVP